MLGHLIEEIGDVLRELFEKEETWAILFITGLLVTLPFIDLRALLATLLTLWWLWVFLLLFFGLRSLWLFWKQELFKQSIEWSLLELNIPREIAKSPQAMEQVLTMLHSLSGPPGGFDDKYLKGQVTQWFSLELVSLGGVVHFFIRTPAKLRDLVEAAFFSFYPDVEVAEVEDYIDRIPKNMEEAVHQGADVWGTELVLSKKAMYPIKTYINFEHITEEKQFDPISTFLEILGKVKREETLAIQILIAPAPKEWKDAFSDDVKKLREVEKSSASAGGGEEAPAPAPLLRSPGQTDVLKAIETNLSKPAFDTLVRFVYSAPEELFKIGSVHKGILGAFNQYSALNLNTFKRNGLTTTQASIWAWPHLFPKQRVLYRKERLLLNFRRRDVPVEEWMGKLITSYTFNPNFASERFLLNTECLATLFHPPTAVVVTAPHVKRVESKKAGPPAGMAIFGGEEEIEKYK